MLEYNNFNSSISPSISNYGLQEYFLLPAVAVGGAMETSSSGTVRGIGAGIRTIGAPLTENIGKEIVTKGLTKDALSTGFKNTFNFKGAAGAGFGMGAAGEVLNAIAGPKREYSGYKGDVTKGLDAAYDGILTAVSFIPGVGLIVGGAMGLAKGVGSMFNKWGGGTDAMTDVDATLGSNFFSWNVGAINGFTGKKSHTMDNQDFMNLSKLDLMWSGYSGALDTDLYAQTKAGKKYGGFSSGARKRANRIIDTANMNREHLLDMQSDTFTGDVRGNLMAGINSAAYNQELYGGIKPVLAGKLGLKFNLLKQVVNLVHNIPRHSNVTPWKPQDNEISKFLLGGTFNVEKSPNDLAYYNPETDTVYYTSNEDLIHEGFHARPDLLLLELLKDYYTDLDDAKILNFGGDLQFVKRFDNDPGHFYSPEELGARVYTAKAMSKGNTYSPEFFANLRANETLYGDNMRDLLHMYNDENLSKIFNLGNPQAFKQGGSMNVIPEGSLHARLHHMEGADGLTKKGIPVVDNNGNQLAEIELNEIIFRKEVTDKLEELAKDGSAEAAIKAGKLLVEEIFENTDDRTGLIEQITGEANLQGAEVFKEGGVVKAFSGTSTAYLVAQDLASKLNQQKAMAFTQAVGSIFSGIADAAAGGELATKERNKGILDKWDNVMQNSMDLENFKKWWTESIGSQLATNKDRSDLYALKALYSGSPSVSEQPVLEKGGKAEKGNKAKEELNFPDYQSLVTYLKKTGRDSIENYDLLAAFTDPEVFLQWLEEEYKHPGKGHWSDKYKKPSHLTYSIESVLGNDSVNNGGIWSHVGDNDLFIVSDYLANLHSLLDYLRYFALEEPSAYFLYNGQVYGSGRKRK